MERVTTRKKLEQASTTSQTLAVQLSDMTDLAQKREATILQQAELTRSLAKELDAAKDERQRDRKRIDELKERVQHLESIVQYHRGYLARVREDDHAGEDLVTVGDPNAPTLTPKRKHANLPGDYQEPDPRHRGGVVGVDESNEGYMGWRGEAARRPPHWVTY